MAVVVIEKVEEHACMLKIAARPRIDAARTWWLCILFKANPLELPKYVFIKRTGLSSSLPVHAMIRDGLMVSDASDGFIDN
ncbi:MAG: hypothetical protein WCF30_17405 [Terracidiphilus sp.]